MLNHILLDEYVKLAIKKKRPGRITKEVFLLHDIATLLYYRNNQINFRKIEVGGVTLPTLLHKLCTMRFSFF